MVTRVAARTFIVRISESPRRVVVEDIRTRQRVVAPGIDEVGRSISVLMSGPDEGAIVVSPESEEPTHPPGIVVPPESEEPTHPPGSP
jgi:hypothetical protein